MKNINHNFPSSQEREVTSLKSLFCPTNGPKPTNKTSSKQQIITFFKLDTKNSGHLWFTDGFNNYVSVP